MGVMILLLLDMLRWSESTLSPITSYKYGFFDGQILCNYLMTLYSLTECQYNEPPLFQQMCDNFINVHSRQIMAMVDAVNDMDSTNITSHAYIRSESGSGENSIKTDGESETRVSAFNSNNYSPDSTGSSSSSSKDDHNYNRTENYNETEKGNDILRAITARKNLAMQNVYSVAAEWFADEMLVCVW